MSQELQEGKPESRVTINVSRKVGKQNGKGVCASRLSMSLRERERNEEKGSFRYQLVPNKEWLHGQLRKHGYH